MKLILFDIDGTLLDSGGAGTKSMNLAFEELFSVSNGFEGIFMAGKTDIQIMKEGLEKHGLDSRNGNVALLCKKYIEYLQRELADSGKRLKPGVRESLDLLKVKDHISIGLLTGNLEAGARIKLSPFGLNAYFPSGAFGDDDEDRNKLLPIAVERFNRLRGKKMEYRDCIVIGDTPRDVECAKIYGAFSIAVATGPYSYESLLGSGADMVLRDMLQDDFKGLLASRLDMHDYIDN